MTNTSSSPLSLVAQYAPLASSVSRQFDARPTLRGVARDLITQALSERTPPLRLEGAQLHLVGSATTALGDLLIRRYLQQRTLNLIADHDYITVQQGGEPPSRLGLRIDELETLIDRYGPQLLDHYKQRLVAYWNHVSPAGQSRWQWLARHLREQVRSVARRQAEQRRLDGEEAETLLAVCNGQPLAGTRIALLQIERIANPAVTLPHVTSDLVITRTPEGNEPERIVLCRPLAEVQAFADMPSLAAAQARYLGSSLTGEYIDFALADIDADGFDAQAMILLEHQLSNLSVLVEHYRAQGCDIETLVSLVERTTGLYDLSRPEELARLQGMEKALPTWLDSAARVDRLRYAEWLARLGEVQRRSAGRHYLEGIASLEDYAAAELTRQIGVDHPGQPLAMADVEVRIYQAPNALLKVVDAGDAHLEYVVISLSELALFNLHGRPPGMLEIEPRSGATLPAWVTRAAVVALVEKVDIGRRYVALLRERLLDDGLESTRRQGLYLDQLRVQLPLKMLELKIRRQAGVTAAGVDALMQGLKLQPGVSAKGATVRQLALRRAPGATPDKVQCAYLIGPPDDSFGACVLYRPLNREPLREFASAHDLLCAVKVPGPLQDDVLLWLDPAARPVYANGGFDEPHIRHFLPGDDAAVLTPPAPATLTGVAVEGDLWTALYHQNVAGLQAIADRQSVSNEESRWLGYRELGWVLFNALLPLFGGPLATAGWVLQSLKIFADGFEGQLRNDPQAASSALMEFFFNAAFVLFGHSLEARAKGVDRLTKPLLEGGEWRDPIEGLAAPVPVPVDSVASQVLVTAHRPVALQALDFSFQAAGRQLSAAQRQSLATFAVPAGDFGSPIPHGPAQGLYLLAEQWYGLIDTAWFALAREDGELHIIDLNDPSRRGPHVRRDEAGRWRIDTGLRLAGGSPGRGRKAYAQAQQLRETALRKTVDDYREKQIRIDRQLKITQAVMTQLLLEQSPQYPVYRQRFIDVASDMVAASGDAVDAFGELNKIKPVPRFFEERAGHLRSLLRIQWEIVSKLREQMSELILGNGFDTPEGTGEPIATFAQFRQGCDLNDRLIYWTGEAQRRLQQLAAVEHFGPPAFEAVKPTWANFGTPLAWRGVQLYWLAILSEEKTLAEPRPAGGPLLEAVSSAKLATQAQSEMLEPGLFTDQEQIQVLDSALQRYEALEDDVELLQMALDPALLSPALGRMTTHLAELRRAAEEQLVPLFRQQTLRARQQRKQQRPARQQVIVTSRRRGVLVGRLKPQNEGAAQRFEVAGGLDNGSVEEFEQDAGGNWERVPATVKPAPSIPVVPFEASMQDAIALLGQADSQLLQAQARIRAGKAYIPSETQNLLDGVAQGLRDKADALDRALVQFNDTDRQSTSTGQSADITIKHLREKAQLLKTEGRRLRIALCKNSDPQASRVQWLVEEGEARIEREGERRLLKSGDYLQEYAIKDDAGVLWYAHFHYPKLGTLAEGFTVAHLKTVAQRFMTTKDFMALGETAKGAKGIIRAEIQPNMARKVYLSVGRQTQGDKRGD